MGTRETVKELVEASNQLLHETMYKDHPAASQRLIDALKPFLHEQDKPMGTKEALMPCPFCYNDPYFYKSEKIFNGKAFVDIICLHRGCAICGIRIGMPSV